jgi:hypothetical protein
MHVHNKEGRSICNSHISKIQQGLETKGVPTSSAFKEESDTVKQSSKTVSHMPTHTYIQERGKACLGTLLEPSQGCKAENCSRGNMEGGGKAKRRMLMKPSSVVQELGKRKLGGQPPEEQEKSKKQM